MDASWNTVAPDFESDGTLRDIYVQNATLADWQATLDLIGRDYSPAVFTRDGERAILPSSVADIFAESADATVALDFDVAGIELACHFFTPVEIEFDLPPEHVDSEQRFAALQGFLRALATTLRKSVVLSPENTPHLPILVVDPTGRVAYNPPPDAPAT